MLRIFSRKFSAHIFCHLSWLIRTKKQALLFLQTSIQKLTDREKSLSNVTGEKKRDERVKFDQPLWLQCHHHLGHYITSCKAVNASIVCFIHCYYWCLRNSYCLYILSSTDRTLFSDLVSKISDAINKITTKRVKGFSELVQTKVTSLARYSNFVRREQ